jgi:hypothetical protein
MSTAVVKHAHAVLVWEQCLDAIYTVLKLEGHVIVGPIPLFSCSVSIFKIFDNKGHLTYLFCLDFLQIQLQYIGAFSNGKNHL